MLAADTKMGVGAVGDLPWGRLKQDMKHFAQFTKIQHTQKSNPFSDIIFQNKIDFSEEEKSSKTNAVIMG